MGIAPVSPGVDLVILGCAIAFRQDRGKCGQISLDLYKITIRDLVPRCFERSLQLSPKRKTDTPYEQLMRSNEGDWGIGHARKDGEAQEMGQSASFSLAPPV